jgi:hypothetical protein
MTNLTKLGLVMITVGLVEEAVVDEEVVEV